MKIANFDISRLRRASVQMWHSSLYHGVGEVRIEFDLNPHFEFSQTLYYQSSLNQGNIFAIFDQFEKEWAGAHESKGTLQTPGGNIIVFTTKMSQLFFFDSFFRFSLRVFYAKDMTWLLFDKWVLSHLRCVLFSLFFCRLECWEPEKCHASLPSCHHRVYFPLT